MTKTVVMTANSDASYLDNLSINKGSLFCFMNRHFTGVSYGSYPVPAFKDLYTVNVEGAFDEQGWFKQLKE